MARTKPPPTGLGRATSTTLVSTPNVMRIRELMDDALTRLNPMEFRFTAERFGSLSAAKSRATSLQNQVASIRARARNLAQVQMGQKNSTLTGEQIRGQYDDLACSKRPLPNDEGYVVLIGRSPEDEFEIYDHGTGERILYQDPREKRTDQLLGHWTNKMFSGAPRPWLTYEEERELYDLNPELFRNLFEGSNVPFPAWFTGLQAITNDGAEFDLVNTPMDDFGVGPGESES